MKKMRVSLSKAWTFVGLFLLLGIFIGDLISLAIFDVSFTNKLVSIVLKDEPEFIVTKEVCEEVKFFDNECNFGCANYESILYNKGFNLTFIKNISRECYIKCIKKECHDEEVEDIKYWNGYKPNATYRSTLPDCVYECKTKKNYDDNYDIFDCFDWCDSNYLEKNYETIKVKDLTLEWVNTCGRAVYSIDINLTADKDLYECDEYKIYRK